MADLPTGTVTFLFTDIEGSTRLFQEHPGAMKDALARHHAILHHAVESYHGYVFQIIGDAFCAAFETVPDALNAALAAQRALHDEKWSETGSVRVRMGIHTGTAQVRLDDIKAGQYFGYFTLARTQRIMSVGHGGQVLLSSAAAELVHGQLPEGIILRDLGEHRLKGLINPEHLWQMAVSDLPAEFPPLQSFDAIPNNLPVQLTSFIGREHELAEARRLLSATRLLTLTGSGGVGKTRLSLHLAADVMDEFPNGVWFVELAPISNAALIPQTLASALGLREEAARPLMDMLSDYFRTKQALLILDNCEHLIADSAAFADRLLHAAPKSKFVASSREALGIAGETTYLVPSLALPDPRHLPPLETLTQYEAVRLFIDRATAVQTYFTVTNATAPAIAQICHRLDGIPLAIELAAARVRALPVEQIAQRLDNRFRLLTGGSRTALPHHQTLQAAIDWSYSLLSNEERLLFQRLSVFAGGWTMEAAEEVCPDKDEGGGMTDELHPSSFILHPSDVLDVLTHLVDKSLVLLKVEDGAARYHMLETIRQYAREKLTGSGEGPSARKRHLDYFLALAERAEPSLEFPEQAVWLDQLEREHDNFRSALRWAGESEYVEFGLRLGAALWQFWFMRGYLTEGRQRLLGFLSLPQATNDPLLRAKTLNRVGILSRYQGDYDGARSLIGESLAIQHALGERKGIADSLANLGFVVLHQGDYAQARLVYQEALAIHRELDNGQGIADALSHLALTAFYEGDYRAARAMDEESLAIWRRLGDKEGIAWALHRLGNVILHQGDYASASTLFKESLQESCEIGFKWGIASAVEGLASIAAAQGQSEHALRLAGAIAALRQAIGAPLSPAGQADLDHMLAPARQSLNEAQTSVAWRKGGNLSIEQIIAEANQVG